MTAACGACGAGLAPGQRFCLGCGARMPGCSPAELLLPPRPAPEAARGPRLPAPEALRGRRLPSATSASTTVAATLAAGVLMGIGLGPVLGDTGSAAETVLVALPEEADAPGEGTLTDGPEDLTGALGAPVGSIEAPPVSAPPPPSPAPASAPVPAAEPAEPYVPPADDPPDPPPAPDEAETAVAVRGTVVQVSEFADSYTVATRAGELLPVHTAKLPAVGDGVDGRAEPLANGTFGETEREPAGPATAATVRGVVTWVDSEAGLYAVSVRGTSLLVGREPAAEPVRDPAAEPVPVGAFVKARVAIEEPALEGEPFRPRLREQALVIESEPFPEQTLEVATVVRGVDAERREVALSVDSAGEAEREIVAAVPEELDLDALEPDAALIATLAPGENEMPLLTGWADDTGRKAADDPRRAEGDQRA